MAKKITLSEIKVKSFNTILSKEEKKAAKGGYYEKKEVRDVKITTQVWTSNTIVDIRDPFTSNGGNNNKNNLTNPNGTTP